MFKLTKEMRLTTMDWNPRSAWDKGVKEYMFELIDTYENAVESNKRDAEDFKEFEFWLLNGAFDWHEYSWGGCSLCYDGAIAERLCTPSELKRTNNGEKSPNGQEEWLDVQARALYQAFKKLNGIRKRIKG